MPRHEIQSVMGPAVGEVFAVLNAQGIAPAGPWLTLHRRRPTDTFDFGVCVPVSRQVEPAGWVMPSTLPAARVVRTVYRGGYDGLAGAWGEFCAWIEASGHTSRADLWERYLVGSETSDDPADWMTELNRPLVQTGADSGPVERLQATRQPPFVPSGCCRPARGGCSRRSSGRTNSRSGEAGGVHEHVRDVRVRARRAVGVAHPACYSAPL